MQFHVFLKRLWFMTQSVDKTYDTKIQPRILQICEENYSLSSGVKVYCRYQWTLKTSQAIGDETPRIIGTLSNYLYLNFHSHDHITIQSYTCACIWPGVFIKNLCRRYVYSYETYIIIYIDLNKTMKYKISVYTWQKHTQQTVLLVIRDDIICKEHQWFKVTSVGLWKEVSIFTSLWVNCF